MITVDKDGIVHGMTKEDADYLIRVYKHHLEHDLPILVGMIASLEKQSSTGKVE